MGNTRSKTQQRNLPTFLNMPLLVTNQVLEKMEPMDLLRARKVCRSLRTAVDKFGLRFDCISLSLRKNEVEVKLSETKIRYTTAANGNSNVIHNDQEKLIDGENFVERALKDLKILSKHAREIEIYKISGGRCDIITSLIELFQTQKCIHVEEIKLCYFSLDEVLSILPCFDAKVIKKIELACIWPIDQFERITHLEQWKNAEDLRIIGGISSTIIVHLFHSKIFWIHRLGDLSVQTAIQMRDDLLRRSTFQSCDIIVENPHLDPIEIAKVFKPDYGDDDDDDDDDDDYDEFNIEYSNGNDKFNISFKYHGNECFILIVKRL